MIIPVIEKDEKKIRQQIYALKWQLEQDIPDKDRKIFTQTIKELEETLIQMKGGGAI